MRWERLQGGSDDLQSPVLHSKERLLPNVSPGRGKSGEGVGQIQKVAPEADDRGMVGVGVDSWNNRKVRRAAVSPPHVPAAVLHRLQRSQANCRPDGVVDRRSGGWRVQKPERPPADASVGRGPSSHNPVNLLANRLCHWALPKAVERGIDAVVLGARLSVTVGAIPRGVVGAWDAIDGHDPKGLLEGVRAGEIPSLGEGSTEVRKGVLLSGGTAAEPTGGGASGAVQGSSDKGSVDPVACSTVGAREEVGAVLDGYGGSCWTDEGVGGDVAPAKAIEDCDKTVDIGLGSGE